MSVPDIPHSTRFFVATFFGEVQDNNSEDILESSFVSFLKINGSSTILTVPIIVVNDNVDCEIYNNCKRPTR